MPPYIPFTGLTNIEFYVDKLDSEYGTADFEVTLMVYGDEYPDNILMEKHLTQGTRVKNGPVIFDVNMAGIPLQHQYYLVFKLWSLQSID